MKNGVIFYSITNIYKMRYFWPKKFFLGHWSKKFRVESNFQLSWPVFHKIYWILYEILMEFDRWILDWWYFSMESKKSLNQFFTHSAAFGGNHPTFDWGKFNRFFTWIFLIFGDFWKFGGFWKFVNYAKFDVFEILIGFFIWLLLHIWWFLKFLKFWGFLKFCKKIDSSKIFS